MLDSYKLFLREKSPSPFSLSVTRENEEMEIQYHSNLDMKIQTLKKTSQLFPEIILVQNIIISSLNLNAYVVYLEPFNLGVLEVSFHTTFYIV